MGLFGNKGDEAGAEAERDRLLALPLPDLAAEVMAVFGPGGIEAKAGHRIGPVDIAKWLLSKHSGKTKYTQPVLGPTIEALGALENAGLVQKSSSGSSGASSYKATGAGEKALAAGSVRSQLP